MFLLALRLALNSLKQRMLSRAMVTISVAFILVINGMVYMLFNSFSQSLREIKSSYFMTAYIKEDVMPSEERGVLRSIRKVRGVQSAHLVSKDSFLENFSKFFPQLSEDIATVDPDVIPRYVKLKVDEKISANVQSGISKVAGVEFIEVNRKRFEGLVKALLTLKRFALVLLIGMSIALVSILLNHFKLVSNFKVQVQSTMGLLGAKKRHIILPFAFEGMIEGGLGGLIAGVTLISFSAVFQEMLNSMFMAMGYRPFHFEVTFVAISLVFIGILSGMMGSLWAAYRTR